MLRRAWKGKWVAPQIDNPEYKGVWKAKQIDNPEFFEDKKPYMFAPFSAVGIELWTMTSGIFFDNMIITRDPDVALDYATKTWKVTHDLEQAKESSKGGPSPFAFLNDGIDGAAAMATNIGVPEEHSKVAVMVTITAMLMTTMWWCCKGDDAIEGTVPSIIERRPALFFLGHIAPIFAPFFLVFSRFSPS